MNILLTIAARGGSKGVKNKNIRNLCGKPLIAVTIRQALMWNKAKHVVVTTDSLEIAAIAKEHGAEVPFMRPAELATDTAGKIPVLRHALAEMERLKSTQYDLIVDLDPTAPVRTVRDLDQCLALFEKKRPKSLFSAVPSHKSPYFNMVELDRNGFARVSKPLASPLLRRQDAPAVYSLNASIYFYSRDYLANPENTSAISDESVVYVMDEVAGIDIDREIDFKYVEMLVKEGLWNEGIV